MLKKIKETTDFIKKNTNIHPDFGIILGTGLSGLSKEIIIKDIITYEEIPNFPRSTVEGHSGRLIFGELSGRKIIAMEGRHHFYEGYNMQEVTFPIRTMKELGIKTLILSNASGGVNPNYEIGELMILIDHINLIPNPLIGKNIDKLGPRFPDMSEPYCKKMIQIVNNIAIENNIKTHNGVYIAVTGPTLETPAEYRYFRTIGGDTVGMSTVPEVITARHMNIPCFAISVITDLGVPGKIKTVTHEDVQNAAKISEPKLTLLIKELISRV